MSNKFKKGQIIQRRFGVHTSIRKASHLLKWGCDVSVEGGVIYAESDGPILNIPHKSFLFMKNGSKRLVSFSFNGLKLDCSRVNKSIGFSMSK